MDEEMAALDANANWELVVLPKEKKNNWVQMSVQSQT
jgi:hypothetical protein